MGCSRVRLKPKIRIKRRRELWGRKGVTEWQESLRTEGKYRGESEKTDVQF